MNKLIIIFSAVLAFANIFFYKIYLEKSSIVDEIAIQNFQLNDDIRRIYKKKDIFISMNKLIMDFFIKEEKKSKNKNHSDLFFKKMNDFAKQYEINILSINVIDRDFESNEDDNIISADVDLIVSGKNDIVLNKFLLNSLLTISGYLEFLEYELKKSCDFSKTGNCDEVYMSLKARLYFIA